MRKESFDQQSYRDRQDVNVFFKACINVSFPYPCLPSLCLPLCRQGTQPFTRGTRRGNQTEPGEQIKQN